VIFANFGRMLIDNKIWNLVEAAKSANLPKKY